MNKVIAIVILALVCIAVYCNTLPNSFMWDDRDVIEKDRFVRDIGKIPFFFTPTYWRLVHTYMANRYGSVERVDYRPVPAMSFALDHAIWKLEPFGYHLTNLILHSLMVIALYFLLCRICGGRGPVPFVAALIFAVHPIHTESVAWVKNRADILSSLFITASCIYFIKYAQSDKKGVHLTLSLASYLAALLSKEIAVVFPLIMIAIILYFYKYRWRGLLLSTVPFFLAAISLIAFKALFLRSGMPAASGDIDLVQRVGIVLKTIGYYVLLLLAPVRLNAERTFTLPASFIDPAVVLSSVLIVIAAFLAVRTYKTSKLVSFGLLWIFITILPVSNISFFSSRPIAEQRLYLPSAGLCIAIAGCISFFSAKGRLRPAVIVAAAILAGCSSVTALRNLDWRDPVMFWSKTAIASPDNPRAHNNLGVAYYEAGGLKDALRSYEKAIRLSPKFVVAYNNMGVAYEAIGDKDKAIESFEKAVSLAPDYADGYNNLGNMYSIMGDRTTAIALYEKSIGIDPYHADAYNNLAVQYYYEGSYDTAVRHVDTALRLGANVNPEFIKLLEPYREKEANE